MADDKKKPTTGKRASTRKTPARSGAKASPKKKPAAGKTAAKAGAARKPRAAARSKPAAAKTQASAGARASSQASAKASAKAGASAEQRTSNKADTGFSASGAAAAAAAQVEDFGDKIEISNLWEKLWRGISMVVFGIIGSWAYVAMMVLASVQFVVVLFADQPSKELSNYNKICRTYLGQVLDFLAYRSEQMPWPLGPLPTSKT